MKIKICKWQDYWYYKFMYEALYTQEEYDYVFKHLDFVKLNKKWFVFFNNKKTREWFEKTYICENSLSKIYENSPNGYQYLKNNWGKNIFKLHFEYLNKQELRIIVNRVINTKLIRGK